MSLTNIGRFDSSATCDVGYLSVRVCRVHVLEIGQAEDEAELCVHPLVFDTAGTCNEKD